MMKKCFSALLLPFIIAGCGSSSSSTVYIGNGEYIDSAVWGVSYECGIEKGITNKQGEFFYERGKECQFSLGNYIFKKVRADQLKSSKTRVYEKDVRIARFLQILDNDGDASNGITVTKEVADKIPVDAYDFNDKGMSKLYASIKQDKNYNGRMVSTKEAQDHIDAVSLDDVSSSDKITLYAHFNVSSSEIIQGESITFDASTSKGNIKSYTWKIGDKIIGTNESFTTTELSLGKQTITLVITDKNGKVDEKSKSINVLAPKTEWDLATEVASSGTNKLLVRSDDKNIYLKFQANKSMSNTSINKAQFYINSDDSEISGLSTKKIGKGLDYKIDREGVYHLMDNQVDSQDFNGVKVQDTNVSVIKKALIVTIDRTNIEYLAENISFGLMLEDENLYMKSTKKYPITHYIKPDDNIAPVITLKGSTSTVSLKVGDSYTDAGATAYDVIDGVVDISEVQTDVDTSKAGVYQVKYTAEDSKHNVATKYRTVEVNGTSALSTFEIKTIGDYNDTIAINHENGQIWMNDNRGIGKNRGCLVATTDLPTLELKAQVKGFCENSDFAGLKWRAATSLELSKFTVKMAQEGKIVGLERKGCIRTLSIDSDGAVKAINTHITKLPGLIIADKLTPAGARCVRGPIDDDIGSFSMKVKDSGKIIIDSNKSLTWVNEYDKSKNACLAIHYDQNETVDKAKDFCEDLDYANYSDWRNPTSDELSNFIKKTNEVHILPGYEASCVRLLAKDDGNISKVVYTRFDNNASHILGGINDLEANLTSNIGLRCVRDN